MANCSKAYGANFPLPTRKSDEGGLQSWAGALLKHMKGKQLDSSLPLDIRATAFQRRVWTYLQSIPFGATRSYSQVAKGIGRPTAVRAVARACATNPVAVAIPAIAWSAKMAAWAVTAGASNVRRRCWRWSIHREGVSYMLILCVSVSTACTVLFIDSQLQDGRIATCG